MSGDELRKCSSAHMTGCRGIPNLFDEFRVWFNRPFIGNVTADHALDLFLPEPAINPALYFDGNARVLAACGIKIEHILATEQPFVFGFDGFESVQR